MITARDHRRLRGSRTPRCDDHGAAESSGGWNYGLVRPRLVAALTSALAVPAAMALMAPAHAATTPPKVCSGTSVTQRTCYVNWKSGVLTPASIQIRPNVSVLWQNNNGLLDGGSVTLIISQRRPESVHGQGRLGCGNEFRDVHQDRSREVHRRRRHARHHGRHDHSGCASHHLSRRRILLRRPRRNRNPAASPTTAPTPAPQVRRSV